MLSEVHELLTGWRIDIRAGAGGITVKGEGVVIRKPQWMLDYAADGVVIEGCCDLAELELTSECDQELQVYLRPKDVRDADGKCLPLMAEFTSVDIDGHELLAAPVAVDSVKHGKQKVFINRGCPTMMKVRLRPPAYTHQKIEQLVSKRYDGGLRREVLRLIRLSGNGLFRWFFDSLGWIRVIMTAVLALLLAVLVILDGSDGKSPETDSLDRCWLAGAFVIWGFVLVSVLLVGEAPTDSAYFTYVGRCLNAGRALYTDIWDCKGPVLYWMSALGVWMNAHYGFTLLFATFWLIDLVLLATYLRYYGNFPGLATFLFALFAFGCGTDGFLVIGRQEALGVCLILMALHLDQWRKDRYLLDFVIGVCGGLAFMIKPTFAAFAVFLLARWVKDARERRIWKLFVIRVLCAVFGGLSVLAVCTAVYSPAHIGEFWNGALLWNLYERVGICPGGHWMKRIWSDGGYFRSHGWMLPILFLISAIIVGPCFRRRGATVPLIVWLAVELAMMLKIPDFYGYYAIVVALPITLACSMSLTRRALTAVVFAVMLVFFWMALPQTAKYFAETQDRAEELNRIGELFRDDPGPVAFCGGNDAILVLNRLNLMSNQRYPFWESWSVRSREASAAMMLSDFKRAVEDPDCRFLISSQNKETMARLGVPTESLRRLKLVYLAHRLHVLVYSLATSDLAVSVAAGLPVGGQVQ